MLSEVTIAKLDEICVQNDKLIFAISANAYKTLHITFIIWLRITSELLLTMIRFVIKRNREPVKS